MVYGKVLYLIPYRVAQSLIYTVTVQTTGPDIDGLLSWIVLMDLKVVCVY